MLPKLKRVATDVSFRGVSVVMPDDIVGAIASFAEIFTLGRLEITCKDAKQVVSPQSIWERAFRRRGWYPIEETHLHLKKFIEDGLLEMPKLTDWHALVVDHARKTREMHANFAKVKQLLSKGGKQQKFLLREIEEKWRPPASEEDILEGEALLKKHMNGCLIPWQMKEFYRLMDSVADAHASWAFDAPMKILISEHGNGGDEFEYMDSDFFTIVKEDINLFRRYKKSMPEMPEAGPDANPKKRKRDSDDAGGSEKDAESVDVHVDTEGVPYGNFNFDTDEPFLKGLESTIWDRSNRKNRLLVLGLADPEYNYITVDMYTGKLFCLSTNGSSMDIGGDTLMDRFEEYVSMIEEADGDEIYDAHQYFGGYEYEHGSGDEEEESEKELPPFTRVESEPGETFSDLQNRVGIVVPKGGALYRVTKAESVSSGKLLVLYNTDTQEFITEGVRERLNLSCTAKSVSVKPNMVPEGHELYVSSTSNNRKLSGGPVLLKTAGDDAGDSGADNDDD